MENTNIYLKAVKVVKRITKVKTKIIITTITIRFSVTGKSVKTKQKRLK